MKVKESSLFHRKIEELKEERRGRMRFDGARDLSVVILGAGPAGLIRAIQSIMDNHQTQVIERRSYAEGRPNTVALNKESVSILQKYGIYQWLVEQEFIHPYDESKRPYISVRLKDLEQAMKAVLRELAPAQEVILYERVVTAIDHAGPKAGLALQARNAIGVEWIQGIDLIVNAEGSHSSTNRILNIGREEVLRKVPVIAAIFQDTRSAITGVGSFFVYVGKTIAQCAVSIYYYAIFIFKCIFQGERFTNANRTIAGALILKTPGQAYLGCGFTRDDSDQLMGLKNKVERLREEMEAEQVPGKKAQLEKELADAEAEFNLFARHWINISFCAANALAFLAWCFGIAEVHAETASRLPLDEFHVIEVGADRAREYQRKMNNTAYVICGDAMATVDPSTGLGANTAIGTLSDFEDVIRGMEWEQDLDLLLRVYHEKCQRKVRDIHAASQMNRSLYRPDAAEFHARPQEAPYRYEFAF